MKQWRWVPATLDDVFPNGTRWVLESLSYWPGYWRYEGRVCRHVTYDGSTVVYTSEAGTHETMKESAKALIRLVRLEPCD